MKKSFGIITTILFHDLVPPLLATDDKQLRFLLFKKLDVKKRKELNFLKGFVKEANAVKNERELLVIAKIEHKGLANELGKREDLTGKVRRVLQPPSKRSRTTRNRVLPKPQKA